jgi:CRISPR-associated protein Cmr2
MLEFYAAWTPYSGPERYSDERELLEKMFNARKALNAFPPHDGLPGLRKSSLDGGRETVITDRGKSPRDLVRLREREELDGPGLLKRFVDIKPAPRFESTTEAAALPYIRKLERLAPTNGALDHILRDLRGIGEEPELRWDSGEMFFEHESREVFSKTDARRAQLKRLRDELYHSEAGPPDAPYYALMQADGDSMGEKLKGLTKDQHKDLSRELSVFSRSIHQRLRDLDCMPIFAGGDELLAVLPLHRLREAAWMVRGEFGEVKIGAVQLTLSAGIAIVHALEPLDEVRELARHAARRAKAEPGKDSVSLVVCPRSGAPVQATGKWDAMGPSLADITRALRSDALSFGFAHELRELLDRTLQVGIDDVLPKMAKEIARKKKESAAIALVEAVKDRDDLEVLTNSILVARKIARAEADAGVGEEVLS